MGMEAAKEVRGNWCEGGPDVSAGELHSMSFKLRDSSLRAASLRKYW